MLVLLVLATLGGGGYWYFKTATGATIAQNLQQARSSISKADQEVATNPPLALHDLASAQTILRTLQQNPSLTNDQRQKVLTLLQGDVTRGVQVAITTYNKQSGITVLCPSNTTSNTLNEGTTRTQAKMIAQVYGKGIATGTATSFLYALGTDNQLYQVNTTTSLMQVPLPITAGTKVVAIASNGSQLIVLTSQPANTSDPNAASLYHLALFSPDQAHPQHPQFDASTQIDPGFARQGLTPQLITAFGSDVYVVFGSTPAQSTILIADYFPIGGEPLGQVASNRFSFSDSIVSIAAFPNHELFVLLADGTVQSLQFAATGKLPPTSVLLQSAIAPPLPVSAKAFTWQMSVPSITPGGTKSLAVPGATSPTTLAVGSSSGMPHLYLLDAAQHRVLDLKVLSGGGLVTPTANITPTPTNAGGQAVGSVPPVTLQLQQQYASPSLLVRPRSMAVDVFGLQVSALSQNTASILTLLSFSTSLPDNCG